MNVPTTLPAQTDSANAVPKDPGTQAEGDLHAPADGDKPFDSFLETSRKFSDAKADPPPASQNASESAGPQANPLPANIISGEIGSVRNIIGCMDGTALPATLPSTASNPDAETNPVPEDEQQSDSSDKPEGPKTDEMIAKALLLIHPPVVQQLPTPPAAAVGFTELNTTPPPVSRDEAEVANSSCTDALQSAAGTAARPEVGNSRSLEAPAPHGTSSAQPHPDHLSKNPDATGATAKSAGNVDGAKMRSAEGIDDVTPNIENKENKPLLRDDGMSSAMQHLVMPDTKFPPQAKAARPSDAPNVPQAVSMDPPHDAKHGDAAFENPDGRKKDDNADALPQAAELKELQAIQTKEASAPAPVVPPAHASGPEEVRKAETVVKQVIESASRMRSDGRSNVELQVKLNDGTEIAIKLQWREGRIQPTFKTESFELRQAIEQNWGDLYSRSAGHDIHITSPVFESPGMRQGANDMSQQQHQGRQQPSGETWGGDAREALWREKQISQAKRAGAANQPQVPAQAAGLELYA